MKRTLIVAVGLALAPAFALAADDTKKSAGTSTVTGQAGQFQALDKNKDGYLSQDELKGQSGLPFSTLDKDGDGRISAQEWSDRQKGAARPTGPIGTPGAAGSSSPSMSGGATGTSPGSPAPSSSAPSSTPPAANDTKKKE